MISNEIESVTNTNILVSPNSNNTRQLVVYSNNVNNVSDSNAMVLPVPLPQTLKFINLSDYKNLFEDCAKCFYNPLRSKSLSYSTNSYNTRDDTLQVFNVGSYKVSVAMNLSLIEKVDKKIFKLSPGLNQILQTFYYQPYWGFIICKLNTGPESYHPFAYSHQIIDSKIYIPTRHYHQEVQWTTVNDWALGSHLDPKHNPINKHNWTDDNINMSPMFSSVQFGAASPEANGWNNMFKQTNNYESFNSFNGFNDFGENYSKSEFNTPENKFKSKTNTNSIAQISSIQNNLKKLNKSMNQYEQTTPSNQSNSTYKNMADDWSHTIYLLNINKNSQIEKMNTSKEIWNQNSLFDPDKIDFDFGSVKGFEKIKIEGTHPNIDLVI